MLFGSVFYDFRNTFQLPNKHCNKMVEGGKGETERLPESLIEWERIQCPRLHDQSPPDPANGWSMVAIKDYSRSDDEDCRSIIFPPINHEGLRLSTGSDHDDRECDNSSSSSPSSPYDLNQVGPLLPPLSPRRSSVVSDAARCWSLGIDLLHSKVTRIAFSLRNVASTGGLLSTFRSPAGAAPAAAAAMLLVLMYLRFRRRRRLRPQKESRDHLIRLIKEKDEKINQLLRQIAEMNEVLLALHRVPTSRTG